MSNAAELTKERLKIAVRETIFSALREKYVSTSSHMDYKTGNAYQEIELDGVGLPGFRKGRSALFQAFDFTDKHVLDCGSNLGELSRLARRRGAVLVDGIEFDGFFVQIAHLINAYHGTTRVSFYKGDLTKPGVIQDTYDIALAFSVFPYVLPIMDELARSTKELLVLETHNDASNLAQVYIAPVSKYFPYNTFVDFTDFGHGEGRRAVFAFAKDSTAISSGRIVMSTVDIARSNFGFLKQIMTLIRDEARAGQSGMALMQRVVGEHEGAHEDVSALTAGRIYWIKFMKGYLEYKSSGYVHLKNPYVEFMRSTMASHNFDVTLIRSLASDDALIERVTCRYRDADTISDCDAGTSELAPIVIFDPKADDGKMAICHGGTGKTIFSDLIDGYHRVFWASFFGIEKLRAIYTVR